MTKTVDEMITKLCRLLFSAMRFRVTLRFVLLKECSIDMSSCLGGVNPKGRVTLSTYLGRQVPMYYKQFFTFNVLVAGSCV